MSADIPDAIKPLNFAETAHDRRIAQLTSEGLGNFYLSAGPQKVELFPAEEMPSPPPLLRTIGFPKDFAKFHGRLGGVLPPSGFYRFEDVYIGLSGTILSKDRRILWSADLISAYWMLFLSKMIRRDAFGQATFGGLDMPASTAIGRFLAGQAVPVMHTPQGPTLVCLIKPGPVVYGHWILDVLPMVWQLKRCVALGAIQGPFRYLVSSRAPKWTHALLQMACGITSDEIITLDDAAGMLHAKEVIVPSLQRVSPLISPSMNGFVQETLSRVAKTYTDDSIVFPRRVYISRETYGTRENKLLTNNEAIIEIMESLGVTTIRPEKMPWPQQLALFSRAELIVGEFGSGLHNAIFGPSSQISIVLSHMKRNWNQSSIAAIRGQRLAYMQPSEEDRTGLGMGVTYQFDPKILGDLVRDIIASEISK